MIHNTQSKFVYLFGMVLPIKYSYDSEIHVVGRDNTFLRYTNYKKKTEKIMRANGRMFQIFKGI